MQPPDSSPRGARPDAETPEALVLVKYCAALHATRQVRQLAQRAEEQGKKLVLLVPKGFRPTDSLRTFLANHHEHVRIEVR